MFSYTFCGPTSWWNLNWKCWNYRQIVQWWYLVFWTLRGPVSVQLDSDSRLTSFLYIFRFETPSRRLQWSLEKPCSRTGSINKDILKSKSSKLLCWNRWAYKNWKHPLGVDKSKARGRVRKGTFPKNLDIMEEFISIIPLKRVNFRIWIQGPQLKRFYVFLYIIWASCS